MILFVICIGAVEAGASEDVRFMIEHPIYIICVVAVSVLCLGFAKVVWTVGKKCCRNRRVLEDKEKKVKVVYYPLLLEENTERGNKNYVLKKQGYENLKNLPITPIAKESHSSVFTFPSIPLQPNKSFSVSEDKAYKPCQNSLNINGIDKTVTNTTNIPRYYTPKNIGRPRANSSSSVPLIPYVYLNN